MGKRRLDTRPQRGIKGIENSTNPKHMATQKIKGVKTMARRVKARFTKGKIEPLENLNLKEGDEVTITIGEGGRIDTASEALARAAGGWKGTLDFEAYVKATNSDFFSSRKANGR